MTGLEANYNKNIVSKLISYIGFAKKARNIYFGADKILANSKNGVIILSKDISKNTQNKLENHALKTKTRLIRIDSKLMESIVQSDRILVFQLLDANLENAVLAGLKSLEDSELE